IAHLLCGVFSRLVTPVWIARVELVQRASVQRIEIVAILARSLRIKRGLCAFFPRPSERISAPLQRVEEGGEGGAEFGNQFGVRSHDGRRVITLVPHGALATRERYLHLVAANARGDVPAAVVRRPRSRRRLLVQLPQPRDKFGDGGVSHFRLAPRGRDSAPPTSPSRGVARWRAAQARVSSSESPRRGSRLRR